MHRYELWAVWGSKCWKCGKPITVAMDTAGFAFNPFADIGEPWRKSMDENTMRALKLFGVKMELRYSKMAGVEYMANVCPHCNIIQGELFLGDEFLGVVDQRGDFKLLLFDNGEIVDTLSSVEEFETKYWRFFLDEYLRSLERCYICGCYISYAPKKAEEYRKYEGAGEILDKYGEIRQLVMHHISYRDNITIDICPVCHAKIHHSKDSKYAKFRPVDDRRAARNGMKGMSKSTFFQSVN